MIKTLLSLSLVATLAYGIGGCDKKEDVTVIPMNSAPHTYFETGQNAYDDSLSLIQDEVANDITSLLHHNQLPICSEDLGNTGYSLEGSGPISVAYLSCIIQQYMENEIGTNAGRVSVEGDKIVVYDVPLDALNRVLAGADTGGNGALSDDELRGARDRMGEMYPLLFPIRGTSYSLAGPLTQETLDDLGKYLSESGAVNITYDRGKKEVVIFGLTINHLSQLQILDSPIGCLPDSVISY